MKKKVAVFANGWNSENLYRYMDGIQDNCPENWGDLHVFLGFDSLGDTQQVNDAEWCVYSLPELKNYDCAIFFGLGMNFPANNDKIINRCRVAGVPIICIGEKFEDTISIHTDNKEGMRMLMEHLTDEHDVKSVMYIAGPKDNADSNERMEAIREVLNERGLPFGEENIYYSNWISSSATDFIKDKYTNEPLPDAIVCANDDLAFFASFVLGDMELSTPEDVILTGFDGSDRMKGFYPCVTSVAQPFYEMGVKTAECMVGLLNGEDIDREYVIPCRFVMGESCGCDYTEQADVIRREKCRINHKHSVLSDYRTYRVEHMADVIVRSNDYNVLSEKLKEFFYSRDSFEGNPFYIFIDPDFKMLGIRDIEEYPAFTLSDEMELLVGKLGDRHLESAKYRRSEGLVPEFEDDCTNHIYAFMPIYYKTYVCGYIAMSDKNDYFGSYMYYNFRSGFNRMLNPYRLNLRMNALNAKLAELMNTDPMTGSRNRTSFENTKLEIQEKIDYKEKDSFAIILFDINNLKQINDNYGHESGDVYIKNSCELIESIFEGIPLYRIGGDEFVVILEDEGYNNRAVYIDKIKVAVTDNTKKDASTCPWDKISFAFGMAEYEKGMDIGIDDIIKLADERMYVNKRLMKENE